MKLVNLKHNADYVRFSKELTIKVNDLITAEVDICGGVVHIDSKLFGKVTVLEDPEACPTYYICGEKTKYAGFKDLYNKLFKDDYDDFLDKLDRFAYDEVLSTYENNIIGLTKKQKIKLLKEQVDLMPRFESDCGKMIGYRQWAVNEVLYTLNIPRPSSKKYNRLYEVGTTWGVDLNEYQNIIDDLLKK